MKRTFTFYLAMVLILLQVVNMSCKEKNKKINPESLVIAGEGSWITDSALIMDGGNFFQESGYGEILFSVYDTSGQYIKMGKHFENGDTTNFIEIVDSVQIVASYEDGKWDIKNCQKAIEVMVVCINRLQKIRDEEKDELRERLNSSLIYSSNKNQTIK